MKTKKFFLFCCLFIKAAILVAIPMLGEAGLDGRRGAESRTSERSTVRKSRMENLEQRSSITASVVEEREPGDEAELLLDSSNLLAEKISRIQAIAEKWKSKMGQWNLRAIDSIEKNEIDEVLHEATADFQDCADQIEKVTLLLKKDNLEEDKKRLFLEIVGAATEGCEESKKIIDFCNSRSRIVRPKALSIKSFFSSSNTTTPTVSSGQSRRNSFQISPVGIAPDEQISHFVAALHAAAHSSKKITDFEELDQRFFEAHQRWMSRENARLKYEAALRAHERTQEELALQKSIHDEVNIEETLPAQVSRCARICSYIFGCINTPCFDVAAFFTGIAGVADEVGKEIVDHPLHRAEACEKEAAAIVEDAKRAFESMQEEAPDFDQATEQLEEEARIREKENIIKFLQDLIPPSIRGGEGTWEEWAERIGRAVNFNMLWIESLANHGKGNPDWVHEEMKSAFEKKIEYLEQYIITLQDKGSSEQREKERLGSNALEKRKIAVAARKTVLEYQRQIDQLTLDVSAATEFLSQANRELDELERTPLATDDDSQTAIDSMDRSIEAFDQQCTKIKKAKEDLKGKRELLEAAKLRFSQEDPIAAEKEIDFNISLQLYQHYGEKLDRRIARAIVRREANLLGMKPIVSRNLGPQLFDHSTEIVQSIPFAGGDQQSEVPIVREPSLRIFLQEEIDALTRLQSYDQCERLGEREGVPSSQSLSSESPAKEGKVRRDSLFGVEEDALFAFPAISRLPDKWYHYLEQIFRQTSESEEKENEHSSDGNIFRSVPSLKVPNGSQDFAFGALQGAVVEETEIGLSLTPKSDEERDIINAEKMAVGKSPREALFHWDQAIEKAKSLIETYSQIIEANEASLRQLAQRSTLSDEEPVEHANQKKIDEENRIAAQEQKAKWTIKLYSLEAARASDDALVDPIRLDTLRRTEEGKQEVLRRYQAVIEAYKKLEIFCRVVLNENLNASPQLQLSWKATLHEAGKEQETWKAKAAALGAQSLTPPSRAF